MSKIGLQLYSLNSLTKNDFLGTIQKVAQIGYEGVEFAGYFNTKAKDLKEFLDNLGITPAATHIGIERLQTHLHEEIDYCLELGCYNIVCPAIPEKYTKSIEGLNSLVDIFNNIGEKCKQNNINFLLHLHGNEFGLIDNKTFLDLLLEKLGNILKLEIDTFWVENAGVDAFELYKKLIDKTPLLHLKDMKSKENKRDTEIGCGVIKLKEIVKYGNNKTEWFIVEQEEFDIDQFESIEISLKNIKGWIE